MKTGFALELSQSCWSCCVQLSFLLPGNVEKQLCFLGPSPEPLREVLSELDFKDSWDCAPELLVSEATFEGE